MQIAHRQGAAGVFGAPGWSLVLLIYTHPIEGCEAERADLEVGHFLAQWLEHCRIRNRCNWHLLLKDLLCLLVQVDPLLFVRGHLGLQRVARGGAHRSTVGTRLAREDGLTAEQSIAGVHNPM